MLTEFDTFALLDTEYTSWDGCMETGWDASEGQYKELVQVAAIKIEGESLEVVETFNRFVQPEVNPQLSEYFKDLTNINQETIDDADSSAEVLPEFLDWLGETPCFSYGHDVDVFTRNIVLHDLDVTVPATQYHDIREPFSDRGVPVDDYSSGTVVSHFGGEPQAQHHNALDDCRNMLRAIRLARES